MWQQQQQVETISDNIFNLNNTSIMMIRIIILVILVMMVSNTDRFTHSANLTTKDSTGLSLNQII